MWIFIGIAIILNLYGFLIMYIDKQRAINNQWRISENHLWFIAIFGGAIGVTAGMKKFRHKTKRWQFKMFLPVLCVVTIAYDIYFILKLS